MCSVHRIRIFAIGGTLISAIRHNAFMPWDDDIDMGYMREDHGILRGLRFELLLRGYHLIECPPGFIIQKITEPGIAMALFTVARYPIDGTFRYSSPDELERPTFHTAEIFFKDVFMEEELFQHLEIGHICGLQVFVPKNPKEVLKRFYSSTVLTEVRGVPSTASHILRPIQFLQPVADAVLPGPVKFQLMKLLFL